MKRERIFFDFSPPLRDHQPKADNHNSFHEFGENKKNVNAVNMIFLILALPHGISNQRLIILTPY
jgi:hypothetical protein